MNSLLESPETETPSRINTMVTNVANAVSQLICSHEDLSTRDGDRLFLRCSKCGRETTGWHVTNKFARQAN